MDQDGFIFSHFFLCDLNRTSSQIQAPASKVKVVISTMPSISFSPTSMRATAFGCHSELTAVLAKRFRRQAVNG